MDWKNKKVLVTGAAGMIGKELVEILDNMGAYVLTADPKLHPAVDLRHYHQCVESCEGMDYVFHLAGIKGSPKMTEERPVDFMLPMLQFDSNMIRAAHEQGVKGFLYTSSIAVLNPQTDKYPAWAKQTGEMLCEAMRKQYPKGTKYCVVRPANVYGRHDNFYNPDAMVVTSLIRKAITEPSIQVWGDGFEERDFINAKDVAMGMIKTMETMPEEPINLCSGEVHTIQEVVNHLCFLSTKPAIFDMISRGDKKRIMPNNLHIIKFKPTINIREGIKEAYESAKKNMRSSTN